MFRGVDETSRDRRRDVQGELIVSFRPRRLVRHFGTNSATGDRDSWPPHNPGFGAST